ncbi:hypothetical protein CA7LBN_004190 [Candidozyma auris]|uniref:Uncharacterized protein n=1 Tax=Candidozyma auris TaxID=498019 RepID=A0A8F2W3X9_CANAR|nr:hypothetical protein CA7LBN_004190 [[Candida] auris]
MGRRFSAGDVDRVKPWTLTREQTIDLMERRQEAAVMRYVRELATLGEENEWHVDVPRKRAKSAREGASGMAAKPGAVDFGKMNSAQIASVMQGEQTMMEIKLQSKVESLRAEKLRRRAAHASLHWFKKNYTNRQSPQGKDRERSWPMEQIGSSFED